VTNVVSGMRRALALWFPFLSADRLRIQGADQWTRTPGTLPDAPIVFVEKLRGALVLRAVDTHAHAIGLLPGLTLADARARHTDLRVAEMDEAADRHWLNRLAQHGIRWTPMITLLPPDGIAMDVTGSGHLFGGEMGLVAQVEDEFASIGMTVRLALATTPEGAQALARYGTLQAEDERAAIRALPVIALGLPEDATLALRRAGLKRIGDVATRPAASIAARFGMETITALRRILGEEDAPMAVIAQPVPLHFERRFAEPIAHQNMVAACFADLLREAARALEERGLGGRCFVLTLFRSDGIRHRLVIETGLPTRDPAVVLRLFEERVTALADPLDPGFGYDSISLFLRTTEALAPSQPTFDGTEQTGGALTELIDRLSTRLGAGAIRRFAPNDSHIPEQAQLALPAIHSRAPVHWPNPVAGAPPERPLFLFDPPQPVEVIAAVPDGPPHRFRWKRKLHEVRLYEGPERIASEWWRRKGGEHPGKGGLTRDYYRIEDVRGRRFWIFRHGLYEEKPDPRQGPKWYLHGLFA
jgi:protein ImuB